MTATKTDDYMQRITGFEICPGPTYRVFLECGHCVSVDKRAPSSEAPQISDFDNLKEGNPVVGA